VLGRLVLDPEHRVSDGKLGDDLLEVVGATEAKHLDRPERSFVELHRGAAVPDRQLRLGDGLRTTSSGHRRILSPAVGKSRLVSAPARYVSRSMTALPPDYDSDPERWRSWRAPQDVHEMVAPDLRGPVLDAGCGEGRLASLLDDNVVWVGVDSSRTQLRASPRRAAVLADMRALPFRGGTFAEVTHLWCLYHLDEPSVAIGEARRVLRPGGRYYACTAARDSDPEIMYEGYPPTSFDAENAVEIVAATFGRAEAERWDNRFFPLETREAVRAYCRHNYIPEARAEAADLPLWLTKRGVLVRATKA
jgi:SAM-dependent methyltransferase